MSVDRRWPTRGVLVCVLASGCAAQSRPPSAAHLTSTIVPTSAANDSQWRDAPDPAAALLAASARVMRTEQFAVPTGEPSPDNSEPTRFEYAPPDKTMLAEAPGHDSWPFYLIAGSEYGVSGDGMHWRLGVEPLGHTAMLVTDPRLLLESAKEAVIEEDAGRLRVSALVDHVALVSDAVPADALVSGVTEDDIVSFVAEWYGEQSVEFEIEPDTLRVVAITLAREDQPDRPPSGIAFAYDAPISVPATYEAMSLEESDALQRAMDDITDVLTNAIAAYRETHGRYPDTAEPETLSDFIAAEDWPTNPLTGEPMTNREKTPGDFFYEPTSSGEHMVLKYYGWDSPVASSDTARLGHPEFHPPTPTPHGYSTVEGGYGMQRTGQADRPQDIESMDRVGAA